jgi:hypothetical protein
MDLPRSRSEARLILFLLLFVLSTSAFALWDLLMGVSTCPSFCYLILMAFFQWNSSRGGIYSYLLGLLGKLAGQPFVEIHEGYWLCLGFKLGSHRFIQKSVLLEHIESVEWSTGQASSMAGMDMDDWHICLWFDHHDPEKAKRDSRKPNQDILLIGPASARSQTEPLALALVAFLQKAGADLIPTENPTLFIRRS